MSLSADQPASPPNNNLVELLDRVIDKGVVVAGDVRLSVAGVDLIYINLRALIAGTDSLGPSPSLIRPVNTRLPASNDISD
ncbi:MAG: gas vesicle protein [Deinococcota bacterium]